MKFEKYLRDKKNELDFDIDLSSEWNNISTELPTRSNHQFVKLFCGFLLILIVVFGSYFLIGSNQEVKKLSHDNTEMIFANLHASESASRIFAVNTMANTADNDIIETLIETLKNDESMNVRLAAARALEKYIDKEEVRIAIIDQLVEVKHSYLKITLVNILGRKKIKSSIPIMNDLLKDKAVPELIKREIEKNKRDLIKL